MTNFLTLLPYNLAGKIYRSPMPFSQMFDPDYQVFALYQQHNIRHAVMLPPEHELLRWTGFDLLKYYADNGIDPIHVPVEDFSTPPYGAFDAAILQVIQLAKQGENLVIHCHAGIGRTGMFAACLARELWGWDGARATAWIRQYIPNAVETDFQVRFVEEYTISR